MLPKKTNYINEAEVNPPATIPGMSVMNSTETYHLERLIASSCRLSTVTQFASSPRTMQDTEMAKRTIVMAPNPTSRNLPRVTASMTSYWDDRAAVVIFILQIELLIQDHILAIDVIVEHFP